MILTNIEHFSRYSSLNENFRTLKEYLSHHNLLDEELGKIELDGNSVFINNINPECLSAERQQLEMHKDYIDVHILLSGRETIGIKAIDKIRTFSKDYTKDGDFALSSEMADAYINMNPGDILICFPEDAHAPVIGEGKIRKAIAKIICTPES